MAKDNLQLHSGRSAVARQPRTGPRRWPGYLVAFVALCLFAGLAGLPWIAKLGSVPSWVGTGSPHLAKALPAPPLPSGLPAVEFIDGARAVPQTSNGTTAAALVKAEDNRIRTALRDATKLVLPTVRQIGSGLPTLILPGRPAPYTQSDLLKAHALTVLPNGGGVLLVDNVVVSTGGTLNLGGASMTVLRMLTDSSGFASIVVSDATLNLSGAAPDIPTTVTSWDPATHAVAADTGSGRSYIRAIASMMTLSNLHTSGLGFWSGRTGGVAWTGSSATPSRGTSSYSTFEGGVFGAYLSNTSSVNFTHDAFLSNEADGIRLHRTVVGTTVAESVAARNGGNGFVVDRAAIHDVLTKDLAQNNALAGYLLDGRALVEGLSPSGASTSVSVGTALNASMAQANGKAGILVEGGAGTTLTDNTVYSSSIGIALRDAARGVQLTGNLVKCTGSVAMEINPGVTATVATANTFSDAHIGVLIRTAPGVRLIRDHMVGNSTFGISVRGASPDVEGTDNVVTGVGVRSLDVQQGAPTPVITKTNVAGFTHHLTASGLDYFQYHPILLVWSVILIAVLLASIVVRFRRSPHKIYAHSAAPQVGGPAVPAQAAMPASATPLPPLTTPVPAGWTAPAPPPPFFPRLPYPAAASNWTPPELYAPVSRSEPNGYLNGTYASGGYPNGSYPQTNGAPNQPSTNGQGYPSGANGAGHPAAEPAPPVPPAAPAAEPVPQSGPTTPAHVPNGHRSKGRADAARLAAGRTERHVNGHSRPPVRAQGTAAGADGATAARDAAAVEASADPPVQPLGQDLFSGPSWIGPNGSSALSRFSKRRRRGEATEDDLSEFNPKPR